MIKTFKIFEGVKWYNKGKFDPWGEEDWEVEKKPTGLIFGDDGPSFNCGDRFICVWEHYPLTGKKGTIVHYDGGNKPDDVGGVGYLVCFDELINEHQLRQNYPVIDTYSKIVNGRKINHNIPRGHSSRLRASHMEKIEE